MKRYITKGHGLDLGALNSGFVKLLQVSEEVSANDSVILVNTWQDTDGILKDFFCSTVIKAFKKGERVNFKNSYIRTLTEHTFGRLIDNSVVLALHPTKKLLDKIDESKRVAAVIIVPWIDNDVSLWKKVWNPTYVGEEEISSEDDPKTHNVINEVVALLSISVNLDTGLTHPNDRERVIDLLRRLRDRKITFDPQQILIEAKRTGWTSEGARELFEICEGINKQKHYRKTKSYWKESVIDNIVKNEFDNFKC